MAFAVSTKNTLSEKNSIYRVLHYLYFEIPDFSDGGETTIALEISDETH